MENKQTELPFSKTYHCLSVSQLTAQVKNLLETQVGEVWVKGEISGFKPSASGHLYFSLKDSNAVISCAMFRGANHRLKFQMKDGLEVMLHGRISVYAPRGNYQLIVDHVEPLGHGALQLAFEQLKAKLEKEGLFSADRKKQIPAYPNKIVIITSPTGAALQDMLNILARRNNGIQVLLIPSLVQGEDAPVQLIKAIEVANQYCLGELIILARGGGSIEDLWCFNNEELTRTIASSRLPIISAVGHEVDFTLSDFAADLRAPTPSAAAEIVSQNKLELIEKLSAVERRLVISSRNQVYRLKSSLLELERKLVGPADKLAINRKQLSEYEMRLIHLAQSIAPAYRQMTDELVLKINHLLDRRVLEARRKLESLCASLEALSPLKVLGRGYTIICDPLTSEVLKSVDESKPGKHVDVVFADGKTKAQFL